jgi:HPt (histidine-containing phosphotransfer) domain-containing protein
MGVTPEDLQAKIAQIAARYLDRVSKEVVQLRALVERAAGGDLEVAREIETLTHRMHGSGAMLQFEEISGPAGELERMCAEFASSGQVDQPRMLPLLDRLQAAVDRACARRAAGRT